MLANRKTVVFEWGDCDPAGVVYYPRYFAYFNGCMEALFVRAGLPRRVREKKYQILGTPMVDARARFMAPLRYGDTAVIESRVTEVRRSSFQIRHRIYKGKKLAVEAFETRVWVMRSTDEPKKMKAMPIPPGVVRRLSKS